MSFVPRDYDGITYESERREARQKPAGNLRGAGSTGRRERERAR